MIFEVYADKVLYSRCARYNDQDGVIFNSEKQFMSIDWLPNTGEMSFRNSKAVPGYKTSLPFFIALEDSCTKLVLVNTETLDKLDIAVMKCSHIDESIIFGSI